MSSPNRIGMVALLQAKDELAPRGMRIAPEVLRERVKRAGEVGAVLRDGLDPAAWERWEPHGWTGIGRDAVLRVVGEKAWEHRVRRLAGLTELVIQICLGPVGFFGVLWTTLMICGGVPSLVFAPGGVVALHAR